MNVHALKKSNVANLRSKVSPEEWQARVDLAAAYRLIDTMPLKNVTSRFAMERIKSTTAYPLPAETKAPKRR